MYPCVSWVSNWWQRGYKTILLFLFFFNNWWNVFAKKKKWFFFAAHPSEEEKIIGGPCRSIHHTHLWFSLLPSFCLCFFLNSAISVSTAFSFQNREFPVPKKDSLSSRTFQLLCYAVLCCCCMSSLSSFLFNFTYGFINVIYENPNCF